MGIDRIVHAGTRCALTSRITAKRDLSSLNIRRNVDPGSPGAQIGQSRHAEAKAQM